MKHQFSPQIVPVPSTMNTSGREASFLHSKVSTEGEQQPSCTRRSFLGRVLVATAAANVGGLATNSCHNEANAAELGPTNAQQRRAEAYQIRVNAAQLAFQRGTVAHPTNGDEELYPNQIGSFTKALPHNSIGEVDLNAYNSLLRALATGRKQDFEAIPLGLGAKLTNPQSGLAFDLEGPDSHSLTMRPAPALASAEAAGELAELYWMALARDVHFLDFEADPIIAAAVNELSAFSDFR